MGGVPRYGGVQLSLPQVYSGLRTAGLGDTAAKNLASVLHIESGGYTGSFLNSQTERPGALNTQGAFGLAQFNGSRQADLLKFAGSPEAAADPQTQLNFIAQDAQARGINLNSVSDIVNRYEVPRMDLRAGEISRSLGNVGRLDGVSYDGTALPTYGGVSPQSGSVGDAGPLTASPSADGLSYGGVETSVGGRITSLDDGGGTGPASVTLDNGDGDASGTAQTGAFGNGINASSFAGSFDASGGAGAGNASVTDGLPSAFSGSSPSLSGATLNPGVSASSLTGGTDGGSVAGSGDNIAGYNSAGPVITNPAVVGAINAQGQSATKAIQQGDKSITEGVKTAGQTIGQAITSQSQAWLDWAKESFVRLAFIVTGLVLFAAALYYFARPQIDAGVQKVAKIATKIPPL